MPDLIVYRSDHPTVLAARDQYHQDVTQWRQRATDLLTELGFPGRQWIIGTSFGARWLIGITPRTTDEIPPRGWRTKRTNDHTVLVPDRRTRGGKHAARRLADCKPPAEPDTALPGMPAEVEDYDHNRIHSPAVREMDAAIWVTWTIPPHPGRVNSNLWKRARLSDYYAALERQQDAKEPSHA